jgi:carboxylesterase type B
MCSGADIDTTASRIKADSLYVMQLYEDARAMRARGSTQVYLYSFDYERVVGEGFVHAEDLSYVMGYIFSNWKVIQWQTCYLTRVRPLLTHVL